jgi:hypothetical protein
MTVPVVSDNVDVGICSVLNEGEREIIDVVQVSRHPRVLHHVEQRQQDVRRPLAEPNVGVEAVLAETL